MSLPVTYYNRETLLIETEAIYGEKFLRWAYEKPLGRLSLWLLVKRAIFSRWYGWRMNQPNSRNKIGPFIAKYNIREDEMTGDWQDFPNFNAFFSRKLIPAARPIVPENNVAIFPADGRHFAIPNIAENNGIFVKGVRFNLRALLGDDALAARFAQGAMLISRLCPVDYHRFHFPCAGVPGEARLISGPLYSVNPIALRVRPSIFWENKRLITRHQTPQWGEVLLIEVGATCVGTVQQTYRPGVHAEKGTEKGLFLFGGSCVITIFEPGRAQFSDDLLENSGQGREVYALMGDVAAELR
ncbi:MAG: phosphatidylserine decarboxylase [Verrucomicrobia bacterium]|nr:phosphatidylserine decarboxylase [Verrucomicrobiota bacterium]